MKWLLILFLCFSCFAWDNVEETKTETKTELKSDTKAVDYLAEIKYNTDYIKYSLFPFDSTTGYDQIYNMVDKIRDNTIGLSNNIDSIYTGVLWTENETKRATNDLGKYASYYSEVEGIISGINSVTSPARQSLWYMGYVRNFSDLYYDYELNANYPNPDMYLAYPEQFSFIKPIAKALDEETTDFQPETLKNVQGMQKINSVNTFVDEIMTDIAKNPNETTFDSSFLVGGTNFADTTFHIDLSSIGQLWVNLVNKYGNGSSSSPMTRSVITKNPFENWVFDLRLRPQQGDYLYPLYNWWNSDDALPRAIRYTLQALVYAYTFYYCFTYTKELWSK